MKASRSRALALCLVCLCSAATATRTADAAPGWRLGKILAGTANQPSGKVAGPVPDRPPLVPGTGTLVKNVVDDFEAESWNWNYNHPKSSEEQDKRMRSPLGKSSNGRWFEGPKRGTPDVVKRVELPAPGLEGSSFGLLIATLHAGVPGRVSY